MNKYKNDIEQHLISNSHRDNESYGHLHSELDEVYRKAQAWDEVAEMIPDLKDWEINDLDFSQTVENIYDRLERDSQ